MYILRIKDKVYNVPAESLGMLAFTKGFKGNMYDKDEAKKYLESLGCAIQEV